ncbi:MAG TPA: hypothetical protein VMK83_02180 [Gaiellaceae bacterium]|nr:hypothetical protein [Gaiellaceae bacterium]
MEDNRLTWLRVPDPAELPADVHALREPSLDKLGFVRDVLRLYAGGVGSRPGTQPQYESLGR